MALQIESAVARTALGRNMPFAEADVSVVPQVKGIVLILSHIVAEKRTVVLNEYLERPRGAANPAYRLNLCCR